MAVMVTACLFAAMAKADTYIWTGANGTDWYDAPNWQDDAVPGDGNIVFGASATGTSVVFTNGVVAAGPLYIDGAAFDFSSVPDGTAYTNGVYVTNSFEFGRSSAAAVTFGRGVYREDHLRSRERESRCQQLFRHWMGRRES